MGRLVLVRHGQTKYNAGSESAELVRGWNDVPLDPEGMKEAHRLADKLGAFDVQKLCTSTLERAEQTGRVISDAVGVPSTACPDLRTWNVGDDLVGKPVKDVAPKMRLLVAQEDRVPPGGESFKTFRKRALSQVMSMRDMAAGEGDVVGVTHARVLQLVKAWQAAGGNDDAEIDLDVMHDDSAEPGTGGMLILRSA